MQYRSISFLRSNVGERGVYEEGWKQIKISNKSEQNLIFKLNSLYETGKSEEWRS